MRPEFKTFPKHGVLPFKCLERRNHDQFSGRKNI